MHTINLFIAHPPFIHLVTDSFVVRLRWEGQPYQDDCIIFFHKNLFFKCKKVDKLGET